MGWANVPLHAALSKLMATPDSNVDTWIYRSSAFKLALEAEIGN